MSATGFGLFFVVALGLLQLRDDSSRIVHSLPGRTLPRSRTIEGKHVDTINRYRLTGVGGNQPQRPLGVGQRPRQELLDRVAGLLPAGRLLVDLEQPATSGKDRQTKKIADVNIDLEGVQAAHVAPCHSFAADPQSFSVGRNRGGRGAPWSKRCG